MKPKEGKKSRRPPPLPKSVDIRVPSLPEISVEEIPMGRQTLSAIWEDRQQQQGFRAPLVTVGYEEVPLASAPAKKTPPPPKPTKAQPPKRPNVSFPEITVTETPIGRQTLADIKEVLAAEEPSLLQPDRRFARAEVLELYTFVVLDKSLSVAADESERIEFVRQRLSHRIPGGSDSVRRVDIRLADDTALMVRVWCEVPLPVR